MPVYAGRARALSDAAALPHRSAADANDAESIFSRFAPSLRETPAGPRARWYIRRPAVRRPPRQSFLECSWRESLGAARTSRASHQPGARSGPSCAARSVSPRTTSGSSRSSCIRFEGNASFSPAPEQTAAWLAQTLWPDARSAASARCSAPRRSRLHRRPDAAGQHRGPSQADRREPDLGLNPRYSFDQFIIGDSNRLAHGAALAVAELPGQAYNPLFLHAPPGLGKTHLLHAIGNYVHDLRGGTRVRYTTVEAFTNHFITALGKRSLDALQAGLPRRRRAPHRRRPVPGQQGQDRGGVLPHLQRHLRERPPARAHLRSPPQPARRHRRAPARTLRGRPRRRHLSPRISKPALAILRKRAAIDGDPLGAGPECSSSSPSASLDNVRALEGALIRVVAFHSLTGQPLDRELAAHVLDGLHYARSPGSGAGPLSLDTVKSAVAAHYGLSVGELVSPSRDRPCRLAAPVGHPPRPGADRRSPDRDRDGLRRPQPRHRAACLQACRATSTIRSTDGCGDRRAHRAPCAASLATATVDRLERLCEATTSSLDADDGRLLHISTPPMTSISLLRYSS